MNKLQFVLRSVLITKLIICRDLSYYIIFSNWRFAARVHISTPYLLTFFSANPWPNHRAWWTSDRMESITRRAYRKKMWVTFPAWVEIHEPTLFVGLKMVYRMQSVCHWQRNDSDIFLHSISSRRIHLVYPHTLPPKSWQTVLSGRRKGKM